ncbi:WD repeat, partial [Fusarium pseudocircinatum]
MAPLEGERSSQPLSADVSDEENRNESTRESSESPAYYWPMDEDEAEDEEDPDYEDEPDEEDEDDLQGKSNRTRDIEILLENGGDDDDEEE